jgi:hypothetical protein
MCVCVCGGHQKTYLHAASVRVSLDKAFCSIYIPAYSLSQPKHLNILMEIFHRQNL